MTILTGELVMKDKILSTKLSRHWYRVDIPFLETIDLEFYYYSKSYSQKQLVSLSSQFLLKNLHHPAEIIHCIQDREKQ